MNPLRDTSDEALFSRYREQGDREAFCHLCDRYVAAVIGWVIE